MEGKEITTRSDGALQASDIRAQVNLIQEVMNSVMQPNVHYGTVPGCGDKPTLLKPGAEKLLSVFRLAANPAIDDLSTTDERRYRIVTAITHQQTGIYMGSGVGEASTEEEKYKWRAAVCQSEFDETPENMRRKKWKKGYQGKSDYQIMQVRTNPADLANTVLKMADKRSMVSGTLKVTGASDIFTQDIEDMHAEVLGKGTATPPPPAKLPERAETPPSAEKNMKTATGFITHISPPNKGGFINCTIEGFSKDDGKDMQFSTKDSGVIETLTNRHNAGEKVSFSYQPDENPKFASKIVKMFAVQEKAETEAQPGD